MKEKERLGIGIVTRKKERKKEETKTKTKTKHLWRLFDLLTNCFDCFNGLWIFLFLGGSQIHPIKEGCLIVSIAPTWMVKSVPCWII